MFCAHRAGSSKQIKHYGYTQKWRTTGTRVRKHFGLCLDKTKLLTLLFVCLRSSLNFEGCSCSRLVRLGFEIWFWRPIFDHYSWRRRLLRQWPAKLADPHSAGFSTSSFRFYTRSTYCLINTDTFAFELVMRAPNSISGSPEKWLIGWIFGKVRVMIIKFCGPALHLLINLPIDGAINYTPSELTGLFEQNLLVGKLVIYN